MDVGLALSGGGVKGAAHIGILQALLENEIKPTYITGTSSGSIVASLYAAGYSLDDFKTLTSDYMNKNSEGESTIDGAKVARSIIDVDWFGMFCAVVETLLMQHMSYQGFLKGKKLQKTLDHLFNEKGIHNISDVKMPLVIPALDINSGKEIYFSNVKYARDVVANIPLAKAVVASCSFPAIFKPQTFEDCMLVDGGVLDNTPVESLRSLGADFIVAVKFKEEDFAKSKHKNFINIADRSINILRGTLEEITDVDIDFLYDIELGKVSILELKKLIYCYQKGYDEGQKKMKDLLRKMAAKKDNNDF